MSVEELNALGIWSTKPIMETTRDGATNPQKVLGFAPSIVFRRNLWQGGQGYMNAQYLSKQIIENTATNALSQWTIQTLKMAHSLNRMP